MIIEQLSSSCAFLIYYQEGVIENKRTQTVQNIFVRNLSTSDSLCNFVIFFLVDTKDN